MKILIIRLSSIGDIVLTQPVVKRLFETFPEAEIHYLVKEEYAEIPKLFGFKLEVIPYAKTFRLHLWLMQQKYDYVFDLHAKFSSFLVKLAAGSALNFTYNKQHFQRRAIVKHTTENYINSTLDLYQTSLQTASKVLNKSELSAELTFPALFVKDNEIEKMKSRLNKPAGKKVVALFPGANHYTKIYPDFMEVVKGAGSDYHFWLLGSKSETKLTYHINSETANLSSDLGGKFNLSELIDIIALSDIVITNDSGPMHIAAAMGKPQIAIFGATHPRLGFMPLNPDARVLVINLSCQPCSLHGGEACPLKHFNCMHSIRPDEIISLLKSIVL